MKLYNKLGSTFLIFQKWMDLTNWLFAMVISLNGLKQKLSLVSQYKLSQYFVQKNNMSLASSIKQTSWTAKSDN